MGLFSRIVNNALPTAIGAISGGPTGAFLAYTGSDKAQVREKFIKDETATIKKKQQQEMNKMVAPNNYGSSSDFYVAPSRQIQTADRGFGATFGDFLGDVGRNIINPFGSIFSQVRPFISQQSSGQPALATKSTSGGQESQQSGTNQAFMGGFGNVLGQAGRFLKTPGGQIGTGVLGGLAGSLLGGQQSGVRITRKMKAQYRAVLNLNMGNYDLAAEMIGVSTDFFIMVLLKRFRNDGPVVTKAALRKTKTTVRRLKSMCDMYDSLRPTATRRKAPMRRAATTLISNK